MITEKIFITGPEGQLEAELTRPKNAGLPKQAGERVALLCHPHPLYGGSMHDGVLQTAGNACLTQGISTLKFNFRGVGTSAGISGRGDFIAKDNTKLSPEVGDVIAAYDWLKQNAQLSNIIVVGYSFGANMLWQALPELALRNAEPNKIPNTILIAPPNAAVTFNRQTGLHEERISIVAGANDDYVNLPALSGSYALKTHTIADADHFFSGQHQALDAALTNALAV